MLLTNIRLCWKIHFHARNLSKVIFGINLKISFFFIDKTANDQLMCPNRKYLIGVTSNNDDIIISISEMVMRRLVFNIYVRGEMLQLHSGHNVTIQNICLSVVVIIHPSSIIFY